MKLSPGEKLILVAMADAASGEPHPAVDLAFVRKAIMGGHTWALGWKSPSIPQEDYSLEVAEETESILNMWSVLESHVENLTPEDRDKAKEAAYPFDLKFKGFDGNNDDHFSVASFLIQDMDRFDNFKDRYLNSHSSGNLTHYRRMMPVYMEMQSKMGWSGRDWSAEQIGEVIKTGWVDPDASGHRPADTSD